MTQPPSWFPSLQCGLAWLKCWGMGGRNKSDVQQALQELIVWWRDQKRMHGMKTQARRGGHQEGAGEFRGGGGLGEHRPREAAFDPWALRLCKKSVSQGMETGKWVRTGPWPLEQATGGRGDGEISKAGNLAGASIGPGRSSRVH